MHPHGDRGRFRYRTRVRRAAGDRGARVNGSDVSAPRLEELERELASEVLLTVVGDLTDPAVVARVVEMADPQIDGLVNAAGIMDRFLPLAELDDVTWDRVMAVNLEAVIELSRAALFDQARARSAIQPQRDRRSLPSRVSGRHHLRRFYAKGHRTDGFASLLLQSPTGSTQRGGSRSRLDQQRDSRVSSAAEHLGSNSPSDRAYIGRHSPVVRGD